MSGLARTARLYIFLLTALALSAVSISVGMLGADATPWLVAGLITISIAVFDAFPIKLMQHVEVTVSDTIKFAAVLLSPAPVVIVGTFLGTLIAEVRDKRVWFKKIFNTAEMTLAWSAAAWVYQAIHDPSIDYFGSPQNLFAILLAGSVAFVVNSILLTAVISFAARLPFRYIWSRNIPQVIWQDLSMLSLGVFLAVLWRYNLLAVLLAGLPLFIVRHSYLIAKRLQTQTRAALEALMQVVDERDQHTYDHSQRVSHYARAMAEELDLRQEEIEVIASAALLHDLGKVGMADDILFNPKLLNPNERKNAEKHAEIGAMLLSKFPLFEKGALLVRHHHERYDGRGYPDGLKGDAIPIGARIIAVADSYQAMTEERPYRHSLSQEAAVGQLLQGSGGQFDRDVVRAFLRTLSAEAPPVTPVPAPTLAAAPELVKPPSEAEGTAGSG
jgi:putative nucleotidyltransferase with HDIG domain